MHKQEEEEEEKEYCVNYLVCPSFSIYSSDKLSNIVDQLKTDYHNDTFEFVSFPKHASHELHDAGTRGSSVQLDSVMKLLISDDNHRSDSLSSTKVDELDAIPADTYCLWTPKLSQSVQASSNRYKKSNSTGSSSKIWKLLDLIRRSKSDGRNTFNFLKKKGEAKSENSKHRCGCGSSNEIAGKKLSGNGERKLPVRVSEFVDG
ncbi:unnamed protein product [Lupinus luteus]|uniref:Uncharacterized protein n=1 Tax=Lupinus luteus TaxID=3873 RepID=A0AAV1XJH9_LUPLU